MSEFAKHFVANVVVAVTLITGTILVVSPIQSKIVTKNWMPWNGYKAVRQARVED